MIDKWREYTELLKQDIKRSRAIFKDVGQTYALRLWAVFIINTLGIIGFAVLKEDFPLPIFLALLAVTALILFDMLWHICSKNIADNFPADFENEAAKRGEPQYVWKCRLIYVGNLRFRGFSCRIYVYENALLVRYRKKCLVISSGEQIKITRALGGYFCEFKQDKKYVRCFLNGKQAEIIKVLSKKL